MPKLNGKVKLSADEQLFFAETKPKEELYDLSKDPQELQNLSEDPEFSDRLIEMRNITLLYDKQMAPVNDVYHPLHVSATDLLEWVKTERPELYQQMLDGVEIGFQTLTKEYNNLK